MAGVNEAIKLAASGCKYFGTPNRGVIVAPTINMVIDVVLPLFKQYCPIEAIKKFSEFRLKIKLINDSEILFRSAEDPERLRGLDLHWFYGDEFVQVKEDVYLILRGRIAQNGGVGFITTTPDCGARGQEWLKRIVDEGNSNLSELEIFRWTSYDNPYFDRDEIERLKKSYSHLPEYFRQEINAEFISISGLVYPQFDPAKHIIRDENDLPEFSEFIAGVDFGYTNPSAILLIGISDDKFYVIKEFYQTHQLISDIINKIKEFHADYPISVIYCDPSRPEFINNINEEGFSAFPGNNKIQEGLSVVRELLASDRLFVFKSCENLIREFSTYVFRKGTDVPVKMSDHSLDALRYAVSTEKLVKSSDIIVTF